MAEENRDPIVEISSAKFMAGCFVAALLILAIGSRYPFSASWVAAEVLLTVLALFVFGSIRYRLDKNALTYGMVLVIGSTFWGIWWEGSFLKQSLQAEGGQALWHFARHYLFTLHGLDQLVHADTMLFILGLTFFVAVIAQTRLLETVSFSILRKNKGDIVPTLAMIIAIVSFASGILDGVSMIGLMIRTLVIILFLAKSRDQAVVYAVMVSTVVTTVCGMWLAYGEPPNLIMKANLHPHLDNAFFLRYCLPVAVGSYFIVMWNLRKQLGGRRVEMAGLDTLDLHTADVRFLQASRHGEVLTPIEFVETHAEELGNQLEPVLGRLHQGESLGEALVREGVAESVRRYLLGKFIAEDLADVLDEHYAHVAKEKDSDKFTGKIRETFRSIARQRIRAQQIGGLSFIPFVGLLIWHALDHNVPLFLSSFAAFAVALTGIFSIAPMRKMALREAKHEYMEYLFLLPLFLSITLLQKTGFFDQIAEVLALGIQKLGIANVAFIQYMGATFLSAMLDNNVVADFAGRALSGLEVSLIHLFAMAQIAGYAVGGCWTHIGCAQSVVAYAFIQKEVDEHYTPFQWMKAMTPLILEIFVLMAVVIYGESLVLHYFPDR